MASHKFITSKVAFTYICSRILLQLVADPLGTAPYTLGTTELECCNIQGLAMCWPVNSVGIIKE